MRRLALVAAAAAALALASGCAPEARPIEEIVFWQFSPVLALQPIVDRFELENPGLRVRVEQLDRASATDAIATALADETPPDLCELDGRYMPAFLASGALSDWSAGVADQRDSLRGWEACRVGDALYGMPWRVSARVLFWNRELFARAGLDTSHAPRTWDQLFAAAARIERLKGGVRGYGMVTGDSVAMLPEFLSYAWGNGGEVLSASSDSSRFDSPRNVEALDFLLGLRRVSLLGTESRLDSAFAAGRLGLRVADFRMAERLDREAPRVRFGVAPVPGASADSVTTAPWGQVNVLASFTRSRHKEQALRLARFLVRPENSVASFAAAPDGMPANAGADTLEWFRARPREALLAAEAGCARFAPSHPAWAEMEKAIAGQVDSAMGGAKTARAAVAAASARLGELAGSR